MQWRDYMAAQALVGLLANECNRRLSHEPFNFSNPGHLEGMAANAYDLADAMWRARKGGGKQCPE